MKRLDNKSDCPVNIALETFGDSWSLLIVRDIIFWGKKTYNEFLDSEEHISTNILANRLADLEHKDIIAKTGHPTDKRKQVYMLTEKGMDLIPLVIEMSHWSIQHDSRVKNYQFFMDSLYGDRAQLLATVRDKIKAGGSIFDISEPSEASVRTFARR